MDLVVISGSNVSPAAFGAVGILVADEARTRGATSLFEQHIVDLMIE